MKLFCLMMFGLLSMGCSADTFLVSMRANIKVVDETGSPLPASQLTIYFSHTPLQEIDHGFRSQKFSGVYDGEEPFTLKYNAMPTISIRAEKEGYWASGFRHNWDDWEKGQGAKRLKKISPSSCAGKRIQGR